MKYIYYPQLKGGGRDIGLPFRPFFHSFVRSNQSYIVGWFMKIIVLVGWLMKIQSTLVISTSVISNNCLSRRENLIPILT